MSVKLQGFSSFIAGTQRALAKRKQWSSTAAEAAKIILDRSNEMIPYEMGELKESGKVTVDRMKAEVVYDSIYAMRQHEDELYQHPGVESKNPSGGEQGRSKFLEKAINEKMDDVIAVVKRQLGDKLKAIVGGLK